MPNLTGHCRCWEPHDPSARCPTEEERAAQACRVKVLATAAKLLRRGSSLGRFAAPVVIDVVCGLLDHGQGDAALVVLRSYLPESAAYRILDTLAELRSAGSRT